MVPNKTVPNKTVPKWTTFTNKPQEVKAKFVVRFPNWTSSVCNWVIPDKMRPLDHCFQQSNLVACHESRRIRKICVPTQNHWAFEPESKAKVFQIFSQKRFTWESAMDSPCPAATLLTSFCGNAGPSSFSVERLQRSSGILSKFGHLHTAAYPTTQSFIIKFPVSFAILLVYFQWAVEYVNLLPWMVIWPIG